ncbi:hypothetical protein HHL28_12340 [Aerophototrophica crusticola]|uniref:Flagellar protein FliL n=1 Tax=Aerophototrophica crusticola TaxID=1709002 RepID=A0A858R8Q5_9PROT|nr:hypothetical protein HHL28_12340 [Rhodospirillaceae bacterium B3]
MPRTLLLLLLAALLLTGPAMAGGKKPTRPPDNVLRMEPFMIPIPSRGPYAMARVQADIVLQDPTQRDLARSQQPRIVGKVIAESWEQPVGEGRITAEDAKALKQRILDAARAALGDVVLDVLLVSLVER